MFRHILSGCSYECKLVYCLQVPMGTADGDATEDLIGACLDYCYKGDISSVVALLDKGRA